MMAAEKKSLDGADSIVDVVHSDEENAHDPATVYQSWDRAYRDDIERKLVRKIDKVIASQTYSIQMKPCLTFDKCTSLTKL
jgi:hypothetical protein